MKNTVLLLPDPDWVIIKSPKLFNKGDWYVVNHRHLHPKIHANATYYATSVVARQQYKCAWCNEPVPETVQGFRNLCEWSEV